ncbi:ribosome biogenesis GTPase Der [Polaromonas naphthalenivorans]|uniref:GTPase Der n=1 Tax=Polaromonas naphthalenivorans (strain CJ2) TaxID=365044 RepID=DER_POLNA|nr:ribosome biogenesis GTPase Der [Polaromonas naphthalenivorans]A1VNF8.1 RecName: Full=GTPase Der; AltName: Full=GTP-binding protein EngA [Polaromonas naphthalenivorans CJ2]ABM37186.1 small GTP-binding protein [Polaromonas naphthalenivorans CJ2]MBH2009722.1 ribosome biogenesis GTPase Der [Xanthomonadaceae bacterium]
MKPVIALVGRPNVGKSTLFNRLTKTRDAIVADFAGLTRDRHYGNGKLGPHEYIVIDTGGFEPDAVTGIYKEMARQTRQAVAESDVVIFVVDARAGISAQDYDIANYLRKLGKPTVLAANKAEGLPEGTQVSEFFELGLGEMLAVSASHGQGMRMLVDLALAPLNLPDPAEETEQEDPAVIKLAVAGRPNVGKSTLINTWLGEERLVAFDLPGTTRDAISVPFEHAGQKFELIDTAGLRRKGKVFEAIEKFSVVKTLQAIENANVVLLLLDATQGVTDQDAHIAGYILESGRAVVLAVNKWDAVDAYQRELLQRSIETRLGFLKFASIHHISAIKRQGLGPVWKSIIQAHASANRKMSTPVLTRLLMEAVQFQQPQRSGVFRPKLRYAHQGGMNPPIVIIHGNSLDHVTESYKRYLEGRIRKEFDLVGTPLRIQLKSSVNPFKDKE